MQTRKSYGVSDAQTPDSISQEPVNILFSPSSVIKKDVWDIDLIQILNLLIKILEKTGKKGSQSGRDGSTIFIINL